MSVRDWLATFAEQLPAWEVAPRSRVRYEAIVAAREAIKRQMAHDSEGAAALFPWAARDPGRTFSLSSGLHLSLEDRWAIFGTTGTGKTTLVQELMARLSLLYPMAARYILDSKGDDHFDDGEGLWEGDDLPPIVQPGRQIIWRPSRDDVDAYTAWFETLLKSRQPLIVYVDELSSLSRGPRSHCEGYVKMLKQGRSLKQCMISLSQETAGIPRQARNQVHHLIRMRLEDRYDAALLDRMLAGDPKPRREPARPHGFWYRRLDRPESPREFSDWRELLA
jgi:hypothetical protein